MNKQLVTDSNAGAPGATNGSARVLLQGKCQRLNFVLAMLALAFLVTGPGRVLAGESPAPTLEAAKPDLTDLTVSNFFSGWDVPWKARSRGDGAPDMSLLRAQTNFVTDVFRLDYAYQQNLNASSARGADAVTGTLEYAFSRRFELGVVGYYNRIDSRIAEDIDGATAGAFARLQFVDTARSSLAANLRFALPNHDLGGRDTTVSLAVTGWQDISALGIKRLGLYYHVQEETLAGPSTPHQRRNDLTYDISLAKTWTSSSSFLGNASTFVEFYGVTDLDGAHSGHTVFTVTPGFRATIAKHHVFMAGVDFPLSEPNPFERIFRITYIYCF